MPIQGDQTPNYSHDLTALDRIQAELQARFPGWQVWYVPRTNGPTAWCARPWPLLNTFDPEHLAEEIRQAHAEAVENWPALASKPLPHD